MEELSGVLLLLIATALVINLVTGGKDGVVAWLRAKALGRTS